MKDITLIQRTYFLGNKLLIISDEAREGGIGCCANTSITLYFDMGDSKVADKSKIDDFAANKNCLIMKSPFDNMYKYSTDTAKKIGATHALVCDWEL